MDIVHVEQVAPQRVGKGAAVGTVPVTVGFECVRRGVCFSCASDRHIYHAIRGPRIHSAYMRTARGCQSSGGLPRKIHISRPLARCKEGAT